MFLAVPHSETDGEKHDVFGGSSNHRLQDESSNTEASSPRSGYYPRECDIVSRFGYREHWLFVSSSISCFSFPRSETFSTDDLNVLDGMKYSPEAHHDLRAACLPGTRTEIIDAMIHWGFGADVPPSMAKNPMMQYNASARVLWVCGTAGSGKTSILHSCAAKAKAMGRRGAYYGFDKNLPTATISCLFSTIGRDLADLDPVRKHQLVESIKDDNEKRTTVNCDLQFEYHIVAPTMGVASIGETVIFIDAFDESGNFEERRQLV